MTLKTLKFVYKPREKRVILNVYIIIINVLGSSFCFIWIPPVIINVLLFQCGDRL